MTDNRIRWMGHSAADINTDYKIYSDEATANTYALIATQDATSPYAPVTTTLASAILAGATSIPLTLATGIANGNYIRIGRETFLVGGLSSNTFADSVGGQHNTVPQDHAAGVPVYKMHETYLDTTVTYGSRHVIRYRVRALMSGVELVAAEAIAVNPTLPTTNDKITIWGIQDDIFGEPYAGITVTMTISNARSFNPGTMETIDAREKSTTTDASGYWEFTAHKDAAKAGGGQITLLIGSTPYTLIELPDVDTVCYLECF
jgi:hypothetical protein